MKETMERRIVEEEIEIDLRELLFRIKRHLLIIILLTILGGGAGYTISKYVLTPIYSSSSMIYVISKETTLTSLADLTIGAQLTEDYKVLIKSRTVMENVLKKVNLSIDYHALAAKITIENPRNTRILKINVTDSDRNLTKEIADATALSASDYIADIMEQNPPKIIEYGEIPKYQDSPSAKKNTLIGAFLATALCIGVITLTLIMDDTIKTEDDIEKRFGLPVIAVIPEVEGNGGNKNGRNRNILVKFKKLFLKRFTKKRRGKKDE